MRKILLGLVALAMLAGGVAYAAGTFQGYPVAGAPPFTSTIPLTGIEQIPADTGLTQGLNPATELITTSQLGMYSVGSTLAYSTVVGSVTAMTVTQNVRAGDLQTQAMTLANAATATITVTNSFAKLGGMVLVQISNGTNTTAGTQLQTVTMAAGSFVITLVNNSGSAALNGNLRIKYFIVY